MTTTKAGLIINFYGRRDEMLPVQQKIGQALGLPNASTHNIDMSDEARKIFLYRSDPPSAEDATVVHLALSEPSSTEPKDAPTVWPNLCQLWKTHDLPRILDECATLKNSKHEEIFWGYSVIFQAALASGQRLTEAIRSQLFKLARRPDHTELANPAEPLAYTIPLMTVAGKQTSAIEGGCLWLIDTPHGHGAASATIYLALAPLKEENALVSVLHGARANLLMPDLIAHKSYFLRLHYSLPQPTESLLTLYKTRIKELQDNIGPFLGFNPPLSPPLPKDLAKLKFQYAQVLYVASLFEQWRFSLSEQVENYSPWRNQLGIGTLTDFQFQQIKIASQELELLFAHEKQVLQSAQTAITMEQVELNQQQEERGQRVERWLTIAGVALAISQIVDATAAGAILGWLGSASSDDRLWQLGMQFVITITTMIIVGLAQHWYHRKN